MLIHLNGLPGVGKLTVGRALATRLGGRLLDNHAVCNLAFTLTDFGTEAFYETVLAVRDIAYARVRSLDARVPVVLTNVLTTDDVGEEYWRALRRLAEDRGSPFLAVTLHCDFEENARRLTTPSRGLLLKLTDPETVKRGFDGAKLIEAGADRRLRLDTTGLSADEAADRIADWVKS
jgi:hypothetical protein